MGQAILFCFPWEFAPSQTRMLPIRPKERRELMSSVVGLYFENARGGTRSHEDTRYGFERS
jgi:hypothetical protein